MLKQQKNCCFFSFKDSFYKKLEFNIGEQIELQESKIETVNSFFINGLEYEVYNYLPLNNYKLFGFTVFKILLVYNGDILSSIIYQFKNTEFEIIFNEINKQLPKKKKLCYDPFVCYESAINIPDKSIQLIKHNSDVYLNVGKQLILQIISPCKH